AASTALEQENVASTPFARSSFSAQRFTSLYARAARSTCAAVGANFGGSTTIRSNVRAPSRKRRNVAKASAASHVHRAASSAGLAATFSCASASASAELSIDVTVAAPPASAAIVKPPV